jgi:hypothetical protein
VATLSSFYFERGCEVEQESRAVLMFRRAR